MERKKVVVELSLPESGFGAYPVSAFFRVDGVSKAGGSYSWDELLKNIKSYVGEIEKKEDNWNLAEHKTNVSMEDGWQYQDKDIKTFIHKVKEDINIKFPETTVGADCRDIIDKRAGDLK